MNKLWLITRTSEKNDYRLFYRNGMTESPYGIPGVNCNKCGNRWAIRTQMPIQCPPEIERKVFETRQKIANMRLEELKPLLHKWQNVVDQTHPEVILKPGRDFQPISWSVPSFPEADFYSHIGSSIVSTRFKKIVEENKLTGLLFFPVILKSVGIDQPEEELPDEDDYVEPIDLLKACPKLKNPNDAGRFINVLPQFYSYDEIRLKESILVRSCEDCGYKRYELPDSVTKRNEYYRENRLFLRSHIPDFDIFDSYVYSMDLVLTPKAYEALADCKLCNYEFQELTVVDE